MYSHRSTLVPLTLILTLTCLTSPAFAQQWSEAFGRMGLDHDGFDGEGYCLGQWNGNLLVGGWFETAGDVESAYIAIWDGVKWESLDGGVNQIPEFIVGTEHVCYVGGGFYYAGGEEMPYCAYWNGSWNAMPGLGQPPNCGVMVSDNLWIGGSFARENTPPYSTGMKYWDGAGWNDPDNFGNWDIFSDEAFAIGDGYGTVQLGGDIMRVTAASDTIWSHVAWSSEDGPIEYGRGLEYGDVECMEPASAAGLWIGGSFTHADGDLSRGLVLHSSGGTYTTIAETTDQRIVTAMTTRNNILHLTLDQGTPMDHAWYVRSYNSPNWSEPFGGRFTDGLNDIFCGPDNDLFVAGFFDNGVVRWDDDEWVHLGGGIGRTNHDRHWFYAMTEFEGDLIAGGNDIILPAVLEDQGDCGGTVRWDGDAWHRLDNGLWNDVTALAVYDETLYAGQKSGLGQPRLQRWTGDVWETAATPNNQVLCMIVHEGELVVGGLFTDIDGTAVGRIAAFNGTTWRGLGDGFDGAVRALESVGGTLYAAGSFSTADGASAPRVASWDGTSWQAMGDGFDDGNVYALTIYDGHIFAGGSFTATDGSAVGHIARWDGAVWQPLGTGVTGDIYYGVAALRGTSTALYVGGDFTTAGGLPATGLAVWDGAWSAFDGGGVSEPYYTRATVSALLVKDGDLWVAGHFTRAGDEPSYCIARWIDGALVPNLLKAFNAAPLSGAGVRLSWRVEPELADAEFRLTARCGGANWTVPWAFDNREFLAVDRSDRLARGGDVHYELAYQEGGRWQDLGSTVVSLAAPSAARLEAVTPNPFNPRTNISYVLEQAGDATLVVYDLTGRRLAVLATGHHGVGRHQAIWQGVDDAGRSVPSGAYLVRLETATAVRSQKVMLLR